MRPLDRRRSRVRRCPSLLEDLEGRILLSETAAWVGQNGKTSSAGTGAALTATRISGFNSRGSIPSLRSRVYGFSGIREAPGPPPADRPTTRWLSGRWTRPPGRGRLTPSSISNLTSTTRRMSGTSLSASPTPTAPPPSSPTSTPRPRSTRTCGCRARRSASRGWGRTVPTSPAEDWAWAPTGSRTFTCDSRTSWIIRGKPTVRP